MGRIAKISFTTPAIKALIITIALVLVFFFLIGPVMPMPAREG